MSKRRFKILGLAAGAAAIAVFAVVGTVAAQGSQRFEDVAPDHYAYEAVNWAVDNGITRGCGDGTNFCPARTLNRGEVVTFLKRYHDGLGSPVTVSWGEPIDASGAVTLTGTGANVAGPVTVTEGRWGVSFATEDSGRLG